MTQQAQPNNAPPAKPKAPTPFVGAAARVQADIDADRRKEAQPAGKPAARRGLPADVQRLNRLVRFFEDMTDPAERLRAIEFLENKYRSGVQFEASQARPAEGG